MVQESCELEFINPNTAATVAAVICDRLLATNLCYCSQFSTLHPSGQKRNPLATTSSRRIGRGRR